MQIPKFQKRTQVELTTRLKATLNSLNLRDWQVSLVMGADLPAGFEDCGGHCAAVVYDVDQLTAEIYINPEVCELEDRDPLHALLHEVGHIWINDSHNEEVKVNTIASLLCPTH